MNAFLQALNSKFTDSDLWADCSGRIYLDQADSPDYPRVVYSIISSVPEKTFSEKYTEILVQFSLFSAKSAGMSIMTTMYADLISLLDECSMNITGYSLVWMKESNLVTVTETVTPLPDGSTSLSVWHVDFEARLSKD